MCWKWRATSRMCSQEICSDCVMLRFSAQSEFLVVNFAQMGGQAGSIDMISQLTTLLFINRLNQAVSIMLAL